MDPSKICKFEVIWLKFCQRKIRWKMPRSFLKTHYPANPIPFAWYFQCLFFCHYYDKSKEHNSCESLRPIDTSPCGLSRFSLKYGDTLSDGSSIFSMNGLRGSNNSSLSQKCLFSSSFLSSNFEFCRLLFSSSFSSFSILPHFEIATDSTSDRLNIFMGARKEDRKHKI